MKLRTVLALWVLSFGTAHADGLFGDFQRVPNDVERGFSVGGDFALLFWTGDATLTAKNPAFQVSFTTGYDIMKFLSVEGIYGLGITEAAPNDPFLAGGVNTFTASLVAKGQLPIKRFYPFIEIGPGYFYSSPEFPGGTPISLSNTGNNKMMIVGGVGFEYYTYLRHFSLYTKFLYNMVLDLPIDTYSIALGIKYTF